jgi:glycerol kinase
VTNQRETIVLWDRNSGAPFQRALVWQDRRTAERCLELREQGYETMIREKTGLVIDPYFSGTKLEYCLKNTPGLKEAAARGEVVFGTIDSFLLQKLSGMRAPHAIEVTNASRTLLMDLERGAYSDELLDLFSVPKAMLPEILPSNASFGMTKDVPGIPDGIPITGILGDQHAALFGQGCVQPGMVKCTFGTGAFLLINTGSTRIPSQKGLLTTLGWAIGDEVVYALEGACFVSGAAVQWLRDGLQIIGSADEMEGLARSVASSDGVYFVPALTGLGAPYWDPGARGLICGITRGTTKAHVARATLDAMAFQVDALVGAMQADLEAVGGVALSQMLVDGGAARNNFLLELTANYSGLAVARPPDIESTVRGAALMAAIGAGLISGASEAAAMITTEKLFNPTMSVESRQLCRDGFAQAVRRARSQLD